MVLAETGDVIGMTTAGFDESDIGFITKSSDICPILNLVREGINPARPRFGFSDHGRRQGAEPDGWGGVR